MTTSETETRREAAPGRRSGPRRSEASRAAVIDAAWKELAAHGWRNFNVDRVARTAHASKQTIYRWWPTPARLAVESAVARLPAPAPVQGDFRDRLTALIGPLLGSIRTGDGAHAWRTVLLAAADDDDANNDFRTWMNETIRQPLRHMLAEMATKGLIRRDWDIDLAMEVLLGPVWHKLVILRGPVPDLYARKLVDTALRALAPG